MDKIKIVIVEDELNSRAFLRNTIQKYTTEFEIVGEAESIVDGLETINRLNPDIILLDIELRDGLSFKILDQIEYFQYKVIFITSHIHYTLKALKLSAIDYILKPVDIDELIEALNKAKATSRQLGQNISVLNQSLQNENTELMIYSKGSYIKLLFEDILALVSDGNYTKIHLEDSYHLVSFSLSHYSDITPDYFYRAHKSCIVNCKQVKSIESGRGGEMVMKNGLVLPVAYRRKSEFMSLVSQN
ncbi:response regulator transcription factor [bacterium]|nr:response regulator transcription factor [bacterium]